jgi:hypothetical protein
VAKSKLAQQADRSKRQFTREEVYELFVRHRGTLARIAEMSGRDAAVVTRWFRNQTDNPEVGRAVNQKLPEILAAEAEKAKQPEPLCA